MAEELCLFIINDGRLYRQITQPTILNFARKKVKGIFDKKLAVTGLDHLIKEGAARYNKEVGIRLAPNPATREAAARQVLDYIMEEINAKADQMRKLKKAGKPWAMSG